MFLLQNILLPSGKKSAVDAVYKTDQNKYKNKENIVNPESQKGSLSHTTDLYCYCLYENTSQPTLKCGSHPNLLYLPHPSSLMQVYNGTG